ncbi:DNA cytosine methyltransferase [Mycolicibacterium sp. P9-22]|uniref:DNA cytosine methyltransferase n=1 Tax=Mycolicibacterium sp. P9-22 TaxID=2024613 RepID=UPI0011ED0F24|nr:DNA cytosine methyltransferase [Mycolicibacterium sp. P9-22]KAA0115092.1 DNA cytosine methyltransferase [Mycolicibacterium sp. P9-22]
MKSAGAQGIQAVDLFCGVGGLTHGLVKAGIGVRAGFDLDPACLYPYEANNPGKFVEADVGATDADKITRFFSDSAVSLLAGCAPCQPFSTYSQSGRSTKRVNDWQLLRHFGRLVNEVQPDLVTMENVPQLAQHSVFSEFLQNLAGYSVSWSVVDAARHGVPQSRKRLVLLASKFGPEYLALPSTSKKIATVRGTIGKLPAIAAGEASDGDNLHVASGLSPLNLKRIRSSIAGGTWRDWPQDLQADCHRRETGATYPSVYGRMEWDKVSPTITTQCFGYGNGRFGHPEQDRAISLREAAMLQTFPRRYKFVPPGDPVKFNVLGRLIGNAVPVRLGQVVGQTLVRHVQELGIGSS